MTRALILAATSAAAALAAPAGAQAATAQRAPFGTLPDGRAVEVITLANAKGLTARILSWGAILQALDVPDARGRKADVVEGYPTLAGYLARPNYFGSTVGRYANRIAHARFVLDGKTYALAANDGPNSLHGGTRGFDRQLWQVERITSGPRASVTLHYTSQDGEEGFPGTLDVRATYALDEAGALSLELTATTDKPTIVNLTGHSYFNLAGAASGQSALDQVLTIPADRYTPVDATLIPTGEIAPVAGTPFDFRTPTRIGARIRDGRSAQLVMGKGYDHNWVIARAPTATPHLVARLSDPRSGRTMAVSSNQPGVQFYAGGVLDGTISGKGDTLYRQGDAVALEPQVFPDTPNQPAFGSARLDPGQTYRHVIVYRFGAQAPR
jgi:aldose 1-epimerase